MMMTFSMSLIDTYHCFSGGTCLPNDTCACAIGYGGHDASFLVDTCAYLHATPKI